MIIKATRLQAWALARVGRRPPPLTKIKKFFCYIGGLFATFSSYGCLFTMWGLFCYFLLYGGGLFWPCPPPPTKISAGGHHCKEFWTCFVTILP